MSSLYADFATRQGLSPRCSRLLHRMLGAPLLLVQTINVYLALAQTPKLYRAWHRAMSSC